MSEDSQSTESLPPSAEQPNSAGPATTSPATANNHHNNHDSSASSPARSTKSRNAAPATKNLTTTNDSAKSEDAKPTSTTTTANANAHATTTTTQSNNTNGFESQPMTVSNSTSSEMTDAAPYSTRSRGRRDGAPRPNYAEDVEMDFELTSPAPNAKSAATSTKRSTALSSVNGSPSAAADSDKGPAASTRRGQSTAANATTTINGTTSNAAVKEPIPGTSTFSANATNGGNASSASRKRKQPPSGATGANPNGSAKRVLSSTSGHKHDVRVSSMMTFENSGARLRNGKLKADDGTTLEVNDHVYLICEPPGEPYYLGRIMEFLPAKGNPSGPVEMVRVNWYYRPKDIQRRVPDPRLVFASMHSDPCPLSSLRGKCTIKHVSEIENLDEYRKLRDSFWYDKMFDRYMLRYYEVVPTKDVINVPSHVKRVLDERWRFVLCEPARKKELTGAVKTCVKCALYAASVDSVDCAVCHNTYHMNCVRPKLTKKPARGFAWACALCSRAQERKLEARNTPLMGETLPDVEEELPEEEEEEQNNNAAIGTERSSPAADDDKKPAPATAAQIAQAKMWPYRYYGIHCQLEDALDYDDRIYPRASSRIGTRHQAIVSPWYGKPVEYIKPVDLKKKVKSTKSGNNKLSKATLAAIEAEKQERSKRPWVMDEPPGFIRRGEDEPVMVNGKEVRTAEVIFKLPEPNQISSAGRGEDDIPTLELSQADREKFVDEYMTKAKEVAVERGLPKYHTNFLDKALEYLYADKFNVESALKRLKKADLYKDLKEPKLSKEQKALFAEGVSKYGSEWINIRRHIGNIEHRHVVRYYYMWKKTPEGRRVWNAYEGRHGKKEAKRADSTSKLLDDIADEADDSAFDNEKANSKKRGFQCKFCLTRSSPQWRRAPLTVPGATVPAEPSSKKADKGGQLAVALCHRCAILWRKYAIEYKDADELAKKLQASGNKAWRRKLDDELCAQALVQQETPQLATTPSTAAVVNTPPATEAAPEPAKKKRSLEKDSASASARNSVEPMPKKKAIEKPVEPPPIIPDPPRPKVLPCAVCRQPDPTGESSVTCKDCRLTVHKGCYGLVGPENCLSKWLCDMCLNDRNPMVSTQYECVMCPVTLTEQDVMEAPKSASHKKKTDRDREKEKMEKEMLVEAIKLYQARQEAVGKPIYPREPLKRTAGNNWVHVHCAIWHPEIKFGKAEELEPAEGFGLVPRERYRDVCKVCNTQAGACVSCHYPNCNDKVHVGCAHQAGYTFGFDVTPVKGSRKDSTITMKLGGEAGSVSPSIWCPSHAVQTVVHEMSEPTDQNNLTALELYVRTYKQADLSMTGTVRKAAHVSQQQTAQSVFHSNGHGNRRASLVNGGVSAGATERRNSTSTVQDSTEAVQPSSHTEPVRVQSENNKACIYCKSSCSPRWWAVQPFPPMLSNGMNHLMNGASSPMHSRSISQASNSYANGDATKQNEPVYECHKCHIQKPTVPLQTSPETLPAGSFATQTPRGSLLPAPRQPDYPSYAPHGNPGSLQNVLTSRPAPPPPPPPPPPAAAAAAVPSGPEWYSSYDKRLSSHGGPQTNGYHSQPSSFSGGPLPHLNGYVSGPSSGPPPAPTATPLPGPPPPPSQIPSAPSHAHPAPSSGPGPGPSPHLPPVAAHQYQPGHYGPLPPPTQVSHSYVGSGMGVPPMLSPHVPPARPFGPSMSPPDLHATLHRSPPTHGLSSARPRLYSNDRFGAAPPLAKAHSETQLPSILDDNASRPSGNGRYAGPGPSGSGTVGSGTSGTNSNSGGASASPSLKNLLS